MTQFVPFILDTSASRILDSEIRKSDWAKSVECGVGGGVRWMSSARAIPYSAMEGTMVGLKAYKNK